LPWVRSGSVHSFAGVERIDRETLGVELLTFDS
jgi:hypothetical protein